MAWLLSGAINALEQAASAAAVHAAWKPAHAAGLDVFAADAGI
ncbi:hypothetical protein [Streptomyces sp. NPDC096032]